MFEQLSWLESLASLITALTIVGGALVWLNNKFYVKPREKKRLEHEERQQKSLEEALKPIKDFLDESKRDRENLHKIAVQNKAILERHETELDGHNDRLIVLEVHNGVRKVSYKEER